MSEKVLRGMGRNVSNEMARYQMLLPTSPGTCKYAISILLERLPEAVLEQVGFQLYRKHIGIFLFLPVASWTPGNKTNVMLSSSRGKSYYQV